MLEKHFNFETVPEGWALCFNEQCPMKDTCLRHMVGRFTPSKMIMARCVLPQALSKDGSTCAAFVPERYDIEVWGLSHLYDGVLHDDYENLRDAVFSIIGRRNFYRYQKGEKLLSAEKQRQIADLFARFGYTEPRQYDHEVHILQFPF